MRQCFQSSRTEWEKNSFLWFKWKKNYIFCYYDPLLLKTLQTFSHSVTNYICFFSQSKRFTTCKFFIFQKAVKNYIGLKISYQYKITLVGNTLLTLYLVPITWINTIRHQVHYFPRIWRICFHNFFFALQSFFCGTLCFSFCQSFSRFVGYWIYVYDIAYFDF